MEKSMRTTMWVAIGMLALVCLAGCTELDNEGLYRCAGDADCSEGWVCRPLGSENVCVKAGSDLSWMSRDTNEPDTNEPDTNEPDTGEYVTIPSGSFTMGSPTGELGRYSNETEHTVTLTRSFEIKATEVTQGEWQSLMGTNPSNFSSCGANCPVETVNWFEALAYANALSSANGLAACYTLTGCTGTAGSGLICTEVTVNGGDPYACTGYRLPTEAEWEYAYRAGTTSAFYNGDITDTDCSDPNLYAIGWYCGNASNTTHAVGQKQVNAWGLYDMSGNVWEWCWDWYGTYPGTVSNPAGPGTGSGRVVRGGSWGVDARFARAANRNYGVPSSRDNGLGFRLSRSRP